MQLDAFNLDPNDPASPDLEGLFVAQRHTALHALGMVEMALHILVDHLSGLEIEVDPDVRRQARVQRAHIEKHRRLPANPKLTPEFWRFGAAIDRALWQSADILDKAIDLAEMPARLEKMRLAREEAERARTERKAKRKAEREAQAARARAVPPVKAPKRPKHEPKRKCIKCGKRPPVLGKFCKPCAQWEARHG